VEQAHTSRPGSPHLRARLLSQASHMPPGPADRASRKHQLRPPGRRLGAEQEAAELQRIARIGLGQGHQRSPPGRSLATAGAHRAGFLAWPATGRWHRSAWLASRMAVEASTRSPTSDLQAGHAEAGRRHAEQPLEKMAPGPGKYAALPSWQKLGPCRGHHQAGDEPRLGGRRGRISNRQTRLRGASAAPDSGFFAEGWIRPQLSFRSEALAHQSARLAAIEVHLEPKAPARLVSPA